MARLHASMQATLWTFWLRLLHSQATVTAAESARRDFLCASSLHITYEPSHYTGSLCVNLSYPCPCAPQCAEPEAAGACSLSVASRL